MQMLQLDLKETFSKILKLKLVLVMNIAVDWVAVLRSPEVPDSADGGSRYKLSGPDYAAYVLVLINSIIICRFTNQPFQIKSISLQLGVPTPGFKTGPTSQGFSLFSVDLTSAYLK